MTTTLIERLSALTCTAHSIIKLGKIDLTSTEEQDAAAYTRFLAALFGHSGIL